MGIRNILSNILGGDDGAGTAERILASSATGPVGVQRAGPAAPGPISLLTHPFLRGIDGDGGKGLSRPYEKSAWVQAAIKHVSQPISSMPLRFATATPDGLRAYTDPGLTAFWARPAIGPEGRMPLSAVVEATVGWLKLAGEAFWVLGDDWLLPYATPGPFVIVRPDMMRHVLSPDGGKLLGWWMRDGAGREWPLLPEQVMHTKFWNPYDPVRGCPEYASARIAAEADVFAGEFARNLMAANGDRGPIITSKTPLSEPQQAQVEAGLRAKRQSITSGTPRAVFIPADITVQDPQVASADADFVAGRIESRKEIYMAFGVPSSFAEQMHRATTAHESDRYILIEDTCKPTASKVAATIATLAMRFKRLPLDGKVHLSAYFDFEQHSVMLQARTERIDAAVKLAALGMPFAQINQFLNLQAPAFPGDDVGHLPLAIQTIDEANNPTPPDPVPKPQDDPPENGDDPTVLMIRALSAPAPTPLERALALPVPDPAPQPLDGPAVPPAPTLRTTPGPEPADTAAANERLWNAHMRQRRPAEKMMTRAVGKVVFQARAEVLRKIEATARKRAAGEVVQKDDDDDKNDPTNSHPGDAMSVIFDPAAFGKAMVAATSKVSQVTMQTAGEELRDELGIEDDPWTMAPADVLNALRDREPLIKNASNEIFEDVKSELEEGFKAGDSTPELADRVRSVFNGITQDRAENIAVTETSAAYGAGREASAKAIGVKTKTWLSARDKKVRPDHVTADSQTVKADENFTVGGESTPYPCGPGLSVAQACRCRCVVLYGA